MAHAMAAPIDFRRALGRGPIFSTSPKASDQVAEVPHRPRQSRSPQQSALDYCRSKKRNPHTFAINRTTANAAMGPIGS